MSQFGGNKQQPWGRPPTTSAQMNPNMYGAMAGMAMGGLPNMNPGIQMNAGLNALMNPGAGMMGAGGGPGPFSAAQPPISLANANSGQQQPAQQNQKNRAFIGTVTKMQDNYGFVDDDVFFQSSVVRGQLPRIGDRVMVEANYNPAMPFKWNAFRIQLLPSNQEQEHIDLDQQRESSTWADIVSPLHRSANWKPEKRVDKIQSNMESDDVVVLDMRSNPEPRTWQRASSSKGHERQQSRTHSGQAAVTDTCDVRVVQYEQPLAHQSTFVSSTFGGGVTTPSGTATSLPSLLNVPQSRPALLPDAPARYAASSTAYDNDEPHSSVPNVSARYQQHANVVSRQELPFHRSTADVVERQKERATGRSSQLHNKDSSKRKDTDTRARVSKRDDREKSLDRRRVNERRSREKSPRRHRSKERSLSGSSMDRIRASALGETLSAIRSCIEADHQTSVQTQMREALAAQAAALERERELINIQRMALEQARAEIDALKSSRHPPPAEPTVHHPQPLLPTPLVDLPQPHYPVCSSESDLPMETRDLVGAVVTGKVPQTHGAKNMLRKLYGMMNSAGHREITPERPVERESRQHRRSFPPKHSANTAASQKSRGLKRTIHNITHSQSDPVKRKRQSEIEDQQWYPPSNQDTTSELIRIAATPVVIDDELFAMQQRIHDNEDYPDDRYQSTVHRRIGMARNDTRSSAPRARGTIHNRLGPNSSRGRDISRLGRNKTNEVNDSRRRQGHIRRDIRDVSPLRSTGVDQSDSDTANSIGWKERRNYINPAPHKNSGRGRY